MRTKNMYQDYSNIQNWYSNSVAFLYTNSKLGGREIKKTISFTIVSKQIKFLEMNLTKEVEYLYLENYKTWKRNLKI